MACAISSILVSENRAVSATDVVPGRGSPQLSAGTRHDKEWRGSGGATDLPPAVAGEFPRGDRAEKEEIPFAQGDFCGVCPSLGAGVALARGASGRIGLQLEPLEDVALPQQPDQVTFLHHR